MKVFDEDNPPDSYKEFKRQVLRTLEETEVYEDDEEGYPSALFIVNREKEGEIYYLKELVEVEEDDEDPPNIDLAFLIGTALPHIIKYENSKFYAFVFSGEKTGFDNDSKVLCVLSGSMYETDMVFSEYDYEDGKTVLEPWQKDQILQYPELVGPFRRAITPQG